jgi:mannose-6-phosphate isomerase-like protein (cupin superfamily)
MQHLTIEPQCDFRIVAGTKRSQVAVMVLFPGEISTYEDIQDIKSEQWFYIISGCGWARVESKEVRLGRGTMLLIEAGEKYQIVSTTEQLEILNFFVPQPNIC